MGQRPDEVLVIGAGVIGLTTAVVLAEAGVPVRIRTAELPQHTTSAVAGAMAGGPVFAKPLQQAQRWGRRTLEELTKLSDDESSGVRIRNGRLVSKLGDKIPPWASALPGFRPCSPEEAAGFPVAFWMTTPLVDMPRYLDYLTDRFDAAGGMLEQRSVRSLADAAREVSIVVNSSGVGARDLAGDATVHPIRGQHVVVENPGIDEFFYEGGAETTWVGYMPHAERVVLGGVATIDDWRTTPDPEQTQEILRRCMTVEPRLAGARVLGVEVGLRPGRPSIRLEEEQLGPARVIHDYGHAGVGVAMSWGCAYDVAAMVLGTGA